MNNKSGCIVCSSPLQYEEESFSVTCVLCDTSHDTLVQCQKGHFVCDNCHALQANDWIENLCAKSKETNPLRLAIQLMRHPSVKMHGPEHHFLVPAVLLSCYYELKKTKTNINKVLSQARQRAEQVPGGFCGHCGNCGAAVGTGIFVSIVLEANPLSIEPWALCTQMTSQSLAKVAKHGGPRCCKRDTFLAIKEAVNYAEAHLEVKFEALEKPICSFYELNKECLRNDCLYYPEEDKSKTH